MILIEPDSCVPRAALPKRELARFLADACQRIGIQGEVTVLLTTNERMRALNRSFRRKNKPTDVLSFPAADASFAGESATGGDLAISVEIAREQAANLGHPLAVEIRILLLHGLLHLAGMDHEEDSGAMRRRESRLRREYGLAEGLIQRAAAASGMRAGKDHVPVSRPAARKTAAKKVQERPGVSTGAKLRARLPIKSEPDPSGAQGAVRGTRRLVDRGPATIVRSLAAKARAQ